MTHKLEEIRESHPHVVDGACPLFSITERKQQASIDKHPYFLRKEIVIPLPSESRRSVL